MTETTNQNRSVVIERELPHPPEKIWRALTQSYLMEEWLMKNDFLPVVGHEFKLHADWGFVNCRVKSVEQNQSLSYTWRAYGLESVVTWTLTPAASGTLLRMVHEGFRPDQEPAYQGALFGWQRFFAGLTEVLDTNI